MRLDRENPAIIYSIIYRTAFTRVPWFYVPTLPVNNQWTCDCACPSVGLRPQVRLTQNWKHFHNFDLKYVLTGYFLVIIFQNTYSSFISVTKEKQLKREWGYLTYNSILQSISEGKWGTKQSAIYITSKVTERRGINAQRLTCLLDLKEPSPLWNCLGPSALGMVPPTMVWVFLRQLTKTVPHWHAHRPAWSESSFNKTLSPGDSRLYPVDS